MTLYAGSVDEIFEEFSAPGSPGGAVGIFRDGELEHAVGYGLASIEHRIPFEPSTVVNLASMSKQFTAMAIALLDDDGALSLDDDVRLYLPELHNFDATIYVRHLLHHTSGLRGTYPELFVLGGWRMSDLMTTEHALALMAGQRELNYQPGEEFLYVNSGYTLLALIVERASGQPFASFARQRVFDPLGMRRTLVHDDVGSIVPGAAGGYYRTDDGEWKRAVINDSVIGPTNVWSTVEDLAAWNRNFTTGEVGGATLVERLVEPGRLTDGSQMGYAYGLEAGEGRRYRGWQVVEHGGQHGGHCGHLIRFPEAGIGVVVLFNLFMWNTREYALRVADLLLDDRTDHIPTVEVEAPPRGVEEVDLEGFTGRYFDGERAALRSVAVQDDRLTYEGHALVAIAPDRFVFEVEPTIELEFAFVEGTRRVVTHTSDGDYRYDLVDAPVVEPEAMAEFEGAYASAELGVTWMIEAADGHLIGHRARYPDTVLTPVFRDGFMDDWGPVVAFPFTFTVLFDRGGDGSVTGFRVSGDRVRNLRFDRVLPVSAALGGA